MKRWDDENCCVLCGEFFNDPHQPACPYSDDKPPTRITKRGWVVIGIGLITLAVIIVEISTNLWWTQNGYCWGEMLECLNNE